MSSNKKKLIIYGDSSYAEMIAHYFRTDSNYKVVAFCADREYRSKDKIGSTPIVDFEDIEDLFSSEEHYIFAAIGYKSVRTHKRLYKKVKNLSFPIARYVSSQSMVDSSCEVGVNCLVLAGSILEPYSIIKENCFVNSGAIVCHNAIVEAHTILASGSLVGGYSKVGHSSLIGFNATIAELLEVGSETLLGAGSLLLQNTDNHTMYVGSPAKEVRKHIDAGIILASQ